MGCMALASIRGRLSEMFGWNAFEGMQQAQQAMNPDSVKKKEAEDIINKEGKGLCSSCKEEIVKNETLGVWESESLLAWCDGAKDHRHKPQVRWTSEDGVHNVQ